MQHGVGNADAAPLWCTRWGMRLPACGCTIIITIPPAAGMRAHASPSSSPRTLSTHTCTHSRAQISMEPAAGESVRHQHHLLH